jgi:single-strand DNA-binding protein
MTSLNRVSLIGRLGADPEVAYTKEKKTVCKFSIATDDGLKAENGEKTPQWHSIVSFDVLADNCAKFLLKGRLVYVEGRLKNEQWEDKEGKKRYRTVVRAYKVNFLDSGKRKGQDIGDDGVLETTAKDNDLDLDF